MFGWINQIFQASMHSGEQTATSGQNPDIHSSSLIAYPRSPQDCEAAIFWLCHIRESKLPVELALLICSYAKYNCFYFDAFNSRQDSRYSSGPQTQPVPYIETPPLKFVQTTPSNEKSGESDTHDRARVTGFINKATFQITGRDQGWASDPEGGSWTWYEIGIRRDNEPEPSHRIQLARNVLMADWQPHIVIYDADEEPTEDSIAFIDFIKSIRSGDRVSIIPRAQFGGWRCRTREAKIEVEVQVRL